jgi:hypothetical protein
VNNHWQFSNALNLKFLLSRAFLAMAQYGNKLFAAHFIFAAIIILTAKALAKLENPWILFRDLNTNRQPIVCFLNTIVSICGPRLAS